MLTVTKRFNFSYAHFLPGHSHCGEMHGHNGVLEVTVTNSMRSGRPRLDEHGMIIDFDDLDMLVNMAVIEKLDHKNLNEVLPGITHPTAENIVLWSVKQIQEEFKGDSVKVVGVRFQETPGNWAEWRSHDEDL